MTMDVQSQQQPPAASRQQQLPAVDDRLMAAMVEVAAARSYHAQLQVCSTAESHLEGSREDARQPDAGAACSSAAPSASAQPPPEGGCEGYEQQRWARLTAQLQKSVALRLMARSGIISGWQP